MIIVIRVFLENSGSIRPPGEYRKLNARTVPDLYPIPQIQDFFNTFHGMVKAFWKLNIVRAYFHILVHPDHKESEADVIVE